MTDLPVVRVLPGDVRADYRPCKHVSERERRPRMADTVQQAERAGWVETLGSRVTVMEASRLSGM